MSIERDQPNHRSINPEILGPEKQTPSIETLLKMAIALSPEQQGEVVRLAHDPFAKPNQAAQKIATEYQQAQTQPKAGPVIEQAPANPFAALLAANNFTLPQSMLGNVKVVSMNESSHVAPNANPIDGKGLDRTF